MGTPEEIVYGVVFLASGASSYVTGSELVIDRGRVWGRWWLADIAWRTRGVIGWGRSGGGGLVALVNWAPDRDGTTGILAVKYTLIR